MSRFGKKRKTTKQQKEQQELQRLLQNQNTMTQIFPKRSELEHENKVSTM
jgi:hypothetical protein